MKRALTAGILVLTAACGSEGGTTGPPDTIEPPPATYPYPTAPDAIVLQMNLGVNQPDPIAVVSGYPIFTLFGDGRLIAEDRSVESGALPPLVETHLSPDGIQSLLSLAVSTGALDPLDEYGAPNIGDADTVRFFIDAGSSTSEFGVYALGAERRDDEGISQSEYEARVELRVLRNTLRDWKDELAAFVDADPAIFTGDEVLVMGDRFGDMVAQGELPIDMSSAEAVPTRVAPILCRIVTGTELDAILPTLLGGAPHSAWTIDGEVWSLAVRPVFPGEAGCSIVPDQ